MNKGQRVEIIDGVLHSEKATVIGHPKTGEHENNGFVFIRFDREGARHRKVYNYAIPQPQWFGIDHLRMI